MCLVELGGLYFFHIISLYYYVSFSLFCPALFSILLLLLHRHIRLHFIVLLPAAIILLAEQMLVSTFYCLQDIIIQVHPPNVVLFYLSSGIAPTCAAHLDRYRYPRFLVDLAFGVDGVRRQFARTATPYRSLLRKSLPYRRGTRSGR